MRLATILVLLMANCAWPLRQTKRTGKLSLQERMQQLLLPYQQNAHIGILVQSVRTPQQTLFAYNANQLFTPASTLKILTAAAALHGLGSQHRFVTQLLSDGWNHNGKSLKNLYLKGSGDPALSMSQIEQLASRLRVLGVNAIDGDIVLDETAFDEVAYGPGWMWDDFDAAFAAPVSALNVAFNQVTAYALPSEAGVGKPAKVWLDPTTTALPLRHDVVTISEQKTASLRLVPPTQAGFLGIVPWQDVVLTGSVPRDAGVISQSFAVRDGAWLAGALLREKLLANHIVVNGGLRKAASKSNAWLLTEVYSAPLLLQLIEYLKFSNNQGMECILKRLGVVMAGEGSFRAGALAMQTYLAEVVHLDANLLRVVDGSGDSRYSLISPVQLLSVLQTLVHDFSMGFELIAGFPVGGIDGTLQNRFGKPIFYKRIRAKTGSMTSVSNLVGYFNGPDNHWYAFVMMMEHYLGGVKPMHRLQEALLETLLR